MTVSRSRSSATAYDAAGKVIFYAPVTSGSTHDPLPLGTWKVTGIQRQPAFNYNPDLFWDPNPSHTKAKIAPGPNNPVGVVWIRRQQGALRTARHAGAFDDCPHHVSRLRAAHQLGRVAPGQSREDRDACHFRTMKRTRRSVAEMIMPAVSGVVTGAVLVWLYTSHQAALGSGPASPPADGADENRAAIVSTAVPTPLPALKASTAVEASPTKAESVSDLRARHLLIPIEGVESSMLRDSFRTPGIARGRTKRSTCSRRATRRCAPSRAERSRSCS